MVLEEKTKGLLLNILGGTIGVGIAYLGIGRLESTDWQSYQEFLKDNVVFFSLGAGVMVVEEVTNHFTNYRQKIDHLING